ncbi:hypothetical protein ACET3Z_018229 [Daucus carota]
MRLAHYLTIGSECTSALACHREKLYVFTILQVVNWMKNKVNISMLIISKLIIRIMNEVGWDAVVAFSIYGAFDGKEYLNAQRIRFFQLQIHQKIFDQADVIVTPTTGF